MCQLIVSRQEVLRYLRKTKRQSLDIFLKFGKKVVKSRDFAGMIDSNYR